MVKSYLVTGGSGFIGAGLVRRLVEGGHKVRVLDNESRGSITRLAEMSSRIDFVQADIRDPRAVHSALAGIDAVCHLAFVNGTEFFYSKPDLVLDVGVKGMVNVIDACIEHGVKELILASSSEVYQTPDTVPTPETAALSIPDPLNPRYSYAAGKIISEIMAVNYGRKYFDRTIIFRPHNVYGPNMGFEHVIPQFVLRMKELCAGEPKGTVKFPVQGKGDQKRAFVFIEDFLDGLMLTIEKGENLGIYHIGTQDEVSMGKLAEMVADHFGRKIEIVPGKEAEGGTMRRCPDISKLNALGYKPKVSLAEGLSTTANWYVENPVVAASHAAPK